MDPGFKRITMSKLIKTLIIDNYDSFTNNLFQYVAEINKVEPILIKNDQYSIDEILKFEFDNIIISPGPGRPELVEDFGVCSHILKIVDVPILGVCLGHQGIGYAFGAEIIHAPYPAHGQAYTVEHNGDILFRDIPREFEVIRYHSLIVNKEKLPDSLKVIASTKDNLIMGLKHKDKPIWGVQFHPESISTSFGYKLLENFMKITEPKRDYYADINKSDNGFYNSSKSSGNFALKYIKLDSLYADDKLCEYLYANTEDFVWLDSNNEQLSTSRFSILACLGGPHSYKVSYDVNSQIITYKNGNNHTYLSMTIFDFIKVQLEKTSIADVDLPFNFKCGFIGYFGYELYKDTLGINLNAVSEQADAQFLFVDRAVVFDKLSKTTYILALCNEETCKESYKWFTHITKVLEDTKSTGYPELLKSKDDKISLDGFCLQKDKSDYIQDINTCLDYIRNGESYEICLTNKAIYNKSVNPLRYYFALRKLSKTPFSAFLKFENLFICCSSMERFLEIDKNKNIQTKPIKGTLPRGKNIEEDLQLIEKLRNEKKYKSENLMIVDLLRHDLGGVCEIGSVKVDKLMDVESYSSVHQLVSTISGKLRNNLSPVDCIKAAFPGGSMVGAPKKRTIKLIDGLEKEARGIYSGSIGYISTDGCVDLNIVIRTAVITPDKLSIGVGGAIIALSDPEEEYNEILLKLDLLKKALNLVA